MTTEVSFPEMRAQVVSALESLSDREHQRTRWNTIDARRPNYMDNLDLNVHVLFDDCMVLPDPTPMVGAVVYAGEVQALRALGNILDPLIDELGDQPDATYLAHARWVDVLAAAGKALAVMRAHSGHEAPQR